MKTQQQMTLHLMTIAARVFILGEHLKYLDALDVKVMADSATNSEEVELNKCIRKVIAEEQEKVRGQIAYYRNLK